MFFKKFFISPKLKSEGGPDHIKQIYDSLYKILIASLIMFVLTFAVRQSLGSVISLQTFWGVFLQLVISGAFGVATYAFCAHLLKSPEAKTIIDSLLRKFLYPAK